MSSLKRLKQESNHTACPQLTGHGREHAQIGKLNEQGPVSSSAGE